MFCPNCNSQLPDGSKACPACGTSFVQNPSQILYGQQQNPYGNQNQSTSGVLYGQQQNPYGNQNQSTSGVLYGQQQNPYGNQNQSTSGVLYGQQQNSYRNQGQSSSGMIFGQQQGTYSQPNSGINQRAPQHYSNWNKPQKKSSNVVSIVIAVFIGIILLAAIAPALTRNNKNTNNTQTTTEVAQNTDNQKADTDNQDKNQTDGEDFGVDISNYNYITAADLAKYAPNLVDQKVYFVATVGTVETDKIQVNTGEGFMYTNCNTETSYVGKIDENDKVIICGQVAGQDSYGVFGNSNTLNECKVVAKNAAVDDYTLASSSDALQEYFYLTEDIANANKNDITEDEFKSLCQTYAYEDILRNEDDYKNKYAVLNGKVDQVIEGWFGSYSIFITDSNGNKWGCTYTYKDGESKMLEGDNVTIYGILDGTQNTTTVLGKQVTLPYIMIEYYEVK